MKAHSIVMMALAGAAMLSGQSLPVSLPGETPRDPYKPDTRYRRNSGSPAQRLIERQRQRNLKAKS